jgi:hypothetical protein
MEQTLGCLGLPVRSSRIALNTASWEIRLLTHNASAFTDAAAPEMRKHSATFRESTGHVILTGVQHPSGIPDKIA